MKIVFLITDAGAEGWQDAREEFVIRRTSDLQLMGIRRGRDSNPGSPEGTTVFETAPFDRSGTSPVRL
jgi:hypothetical protein